MRCCARPLACQRCFLNQATSQKQTFDTRRLPAQGNRILTSASLADDHDILRLSEHTHILALLRRKFGARHACMSAGSAGPAAPDVAAQPGAGDLPPCSGRKGTGGASQLELNVFVVEALRFEGGIWACYDNFLEGTKSGEPACGYVRTVRKRHRGRGASCFSLLHAAGLQRAFTLLRP